MRLIMSKCRITKPILSWYKLTFELGHSFPNNNPHQQLSNFWCNLGSVGLSSNEFRWKIIDDECLSRERQKTNFSGARVEIHFGGIWRQESHLAGNHRFLFLLLSPENKWTVEDSFSSVNLSEKFIQSLIVWSLMRESLEQSWSTICGKVLQSSITTHS